MQAMRATQAIEAMYVAQAISFEILKVAKTSFFKVKQGGGWTERRVEGGEPEMKLIFDDDNHDDDDDDDNDDDENDDDGDGNDPI